MIEGWHLAASTPKGKSPTFSTPGRPLLRGGRSRNRVSARAGRRLAGGEMVVEIGCPGFVLHATTPAAFSKGRLIRCTVPGSTPAISRTPGRPVSRRAGQIRFHVALWSFPPALVLALGPRKPGAASHPDHANRRSDRFTSPEIAPRKFQPHFGRHHPLTKTCNFE
jgi:hypothetical protein